MRIQQKQTLSECTVCSSPNDYQTLNQHQIIFFFNVKFFTIKFYFPTEKKTNKQKIETVTEILMAFTTNTITNHQI